jgi:hypothetical protein
MVANTCGLSSCVMLTSWKSLWFAARWTSWVARLLLLALQCSWCSIAHWAITDAISKSQNCRLKLPYWFVCVCSELTCSVGVVPLGHAGSIFGGSWPDRDMDLFTIAMSAWCPSHFLWCVVRMLQTAVVCIMCGIDSVSFSCRTALQSSTHSGGHSIACSLGIELPRRVRSSNF